RGVRAARLRRGQRHDRRPHRTGGPRGGDRRQHGAVRALGDLRRLRSPRARVGRGDRGRLAGRLADRMSGALTLSQIGRLAWDVVLAVLPLVVLFATFQVFFLKLPGREVRRILTGTAIAAVGLFLFLFGVNLGFLPFGRAIGEAVGTLPSKWMMGAFGLVLGFVTTWGEPAVRILADQVEEASAGSIRSSLVLAAICIGVAVAVCLGMLRIAYGITLLYIL